LEGTIGEGEEAKREGERKVIKEGLRLVRLRLRLSEQKDST
jgi:hypothetical protein